MTDRGWSGPQDMHSTATPFNEQSFMIRQMIGKITTNELVQVEAVDPAAGTVDVLPLVYQVDGQGQPFPHATIHKLPYFRLQGGTRGAVILDPQPGDIGLAAFCGRDISVVKTTKAPALPGSRRRFDWADGLYLGGFLNGTPTQYVEFTDSGITLKTPNTVTIDAPTATFTGDVVVQGGASFADDVTMAAKLTTSGMTSLGGGSQFLKRADGSNTTNVKGT
jgi:hypothetical protein